MEKIPVSQLIQNRREAIGWSQEKLAEGICSAPTVSRIENGRRMPSERVLQALMERLGLEDARVMIPQSPYEWNVEDLWAEARTCVVRFHRAGEEEKPALREEALTYIQKLESIVKQDDLMTRQQIMGERISLGKAEGPYTMREKVDLLLEAIRLTIPRFDLRRINDFRYTMAEVVLVNQVGVAYTRGGEWESALSVYRQLYTYLKENTPPTARYAGKRAMLAANYARELNVCERYRESADVAEEGRQFCVKYGEYQFLPMLLALLANSYAHLENRDISLDFYKRAFFLYQEYGDTKNLDNLKQDALDTLGVELSD